MKCRISYICTTEKLKQETTNQSLARQRKYTLPHSHDRKSTRCGTGGRWHLVGRGLHLGRSPFGHWVARWWTVFRLHIQTTFGVVTRARSLVLTLQLLRVEGLDLLRTYALNGHYSRALPHLESMTYIVANYKSVGALQNKDEIRRGWRTFMKKACQGLGFRGMLEGGATYLVVCQSLLVNELQSLDEMNESNQEQVVVPHNNKRRLASSRGACMS
jgi:hypothetical protein